MHNETTHSTRQQLKVPIHIVKKIQYSYTYLSYKFAFSEASAQIKTKTQTLEWFETKTWTTIVDNCEFYMQTIKYRYLNS